MNNVVNLKNMSIISVEFCLLGLFNSLANIVFLVVFLEVFPDLGSRDLVPVLDH